LPSSSSAPPKPTTMMWHGVPVLEAAHASVRGIPAA
jgi:hypothetical protein